MNQHLNPSILPLGKFQDPALTAKGETRAQVALRGLEVLWFNTGTLCNITCVNCYIDSSPTNDALVYLTAQDVISYLDEAAALNAPLSEIGFTGGEPFMNPEMAAMAEACLARNLRVLILTNAMLPMQRKRVQAELLDLKARYGDLLTLRISLDHHQAEEHDRMRGKGSFAVSLRGMRWLAKNGFQMSVAARTIWGETDSQARAGFSALFAREGFAIDASAPASLVLFPEMDETVEVPEITTECWSILNKSPDDVMCANARMVVKRKGADAPAVLACTLLPYDAQFELGATLAEASKPVALNHKHCAKFCVLGGASCSG